MHLAIHLSPFTCSIPTTGLYYNTSDASPDVNHNRQPFGFQPLELPHFPPGGPLVLETSLSQASGLAMAVEGAVAG